MATAPGNVKRGRPRRTHSGRYTELHADKLRGGYYTPPDLAQWLARWAIRESCDRVLEPSCGNGVFVVKSALRLRELGASPAAVAAQIQAIEVAPGEARFARERLEEAAPGCARQVVRTGDFFGWWTDRSALPFDAAIGNPPFIRYQTFPEPFRGRAMEILRELGLAPNKLTNMWVPFIAAVTATLRPGGRMAFVAPAELLQVSYAAQLRRFLTQRFRRITIVTCNELFFENAEQEVVLLLADGAFPQRPGATTCRVAMVETRRVRDLLRESPKKLVAAARPKDVEPGTEKWLKYFLKEREISLLRELRSAGSCRPLGAYAEVDVGVVTGNNDFFVLSRNQVRELDAQSQTLPLISRSAHLRGTQVDRKEWEALAAAGQRVYLLHLARAAGAPLRGALADYIRSGERRNVHKGYKCSIRSPWYAVPSVWRPHGFVLRQIYDFPRMVLNRADAASTDTLHRLTCADRPEEVIANSYTYLTAASAEIEGRSYGGGVLELEPTEAEQLLMPAPLADALPLEECDRLVRAGRLEKVLEENSRRVLRNAMGLSSADCGVLRAAWTKLRDRRLARRRRTPERRAPGGAADRTIQGPF